MTTVLTRLISFLGFGGTFLLISPNLRNTLTGGLESVTHQLELYAPWSYIGGVVLILLLLMYSMYRGAQPG